jgi:uncharacterized damage-inducible protein DinB
VIASIAEFEELWTQESNETRKILAELTDRSLAQAVTKDHRTLGRLAWHITTSVGEMMNRTGLQVSGPPGDSAVPATAAAIRAGYDEAARSLLAEMKGKWKDASLQVEDEMYGQKWKRALTLAILVAHQTHHRGQMTVLMRQAGLKVPGVYGPSKEEWAAMGAPPPEV